MEVDGRGEEQIIQPVVGSDGKNTGQMALVPIPLEFLLFPWSIDGPFRVGRSKSRENPHKIDRQRAFGEDGSVRTARLKATSVCDPKPTVLFFESNRRAALPEYGSRGIFRRF
jgi:hypothetical protein